MERKIQKDQKINKWWKVDEKDAERNVSNVERKEQLALGHSVEVDKKHLLYNRKKQSRL